MYAVGEALRRRTVGDMRMHRRGETGVGSWLPITLAAALVVAIGIVGATWLTRDDTSPSSADPRPTATPGTTQSAAPAAQPRAVPVYYLGDAARGHRLFREFHRRTTCATAACLLQASVTEAVAGSPVDPDYQRPWPADTEADATYDGSTLTVDLTGDVVGLPEGMSAKDAALAIQQLVYSAEAGLGKGRVPVRLLVAGEHDTVLGQDVGDAVEAQPEEDVVALVQVDSPAEDAAGLPATFTVSGRANAFEATVQWEVRRGDKVIRKGFATAQECCTLSPYKFNVSVPPGDYVLTVHDTDESDGEGGGGVNADTKEISVG